MEEKRDLIQPKAHYTICGGDMLCCLISTKCTRQQILDSATGKVISDRCVNCEI
ncbi:hypothetical protein [Peribacillus muralis]|uniref:hypothetical protein n=1 Tax=Peribacillus muralis TaxID=264697 RepID=UPI001379F623|nr:hypothetical protein [Peribacillus muralis]